MIVSEGLDYILSHFEEPLFPRTISTKKTENRQVVVNSRYEALRYYEESNLEDCRVSAFSQYEIKNNIPNLIFIDLDDKSALNGTLQFIGMNVGGIPTVLSTGNGYGIIQPVKMTSWNGVTYHGKISAELTTLFLQYVERYFSCGTYDTAHHPSLKSCLIRIPNSINSKNGNHVSVQMMWDGVRVDVHNLKFKEFVKKLSNDESFLKQKRETFVGYTISYIEKLLTSSISEGRKRVCNLILIPYMINVKQLSIEETVEIIYCYFQGHIDRNSIMYESKRVLRKGVFPYGLNKMRLMDSQLYDIVTN
jgi:hypothetical protein